MAAATECSTCGAPGRVDGAECAFCGDAAPAAATRPSYEAAGGQSREVIPADLPAAPEARRFRGLAVPLVAGLVVVGIGFPLTALAVAQVGRLPETTETSPSAADDPGAAGPKRAVIGSPTGQAHVTGAVTYDGAATPLGCNVGPPKLVTFDAGPDRYSILVSAPPGVTAGTYPIEPASGGFVAVTRLVGGTQTWTTLARANAGGEITIRPDRSVSARFTGLEPSGGGAEGTVDGSLEARCE